MFLCVIFSLKEKEVTVSAMGPVHLNWKSISTGSLIEVNGKRNLRKH